MERENSSQPLPDLEQLAAAKGAPLDVEDLDDLGFKAASARGLIEEKDNLGEGAGGAVTKCVLKGGKTVFALKVRRANLSFILLHHLTAWVDHHNESGPRCQEADCA